MPEYDQTNSGAMFLEEDKEKPNWPDFSGSIDVEGVEYWISGWKKTSKKSGKKFISISIKPKERRREPVRSHTDEPPQEPW